MSAREAFEAWFLPRYHYTRIDGEVGNNMFAAWSARDAELASKDARIEQLERALRELPNVVPRTARGEITVRVVREYIDEALR